MKRVLLPILMLTAVIAATVWVYFLPHFAIRRINSSIERGDTVALSRDIDFPTLRGNLKEQIRFLRATADMKGVKADRTFMMLDTLVDAYVTPYGLSQLKHDGVTYPTGTPRKTVDYFGFEDASYAYQSPSQFVVTINLQLDDKRRDRLRFVLIRSGLSWRLNNILFADVMLDHLFGNTASGQVTSTPRGTPTPMEPLKEFMPDFKSSASPSASPWNGMIVSRT
jgi:hypothetical protein